MGVGHFAFSLSDPNAALAYFTFVDGYQPFIPAITIDMTILNDSSGNISVDNTTAGNDNSGQSGMSKVTFFLLLTCILKRVLTLAQAL